METRKKDGIHEKTDEETDQHNLQSTNKNAECEKQLQKQPPKHWIPDVQEPNRNTKTHTRRVPTNPLGKHTKNNRRWNLQHRPRHLNKSKQENHLNHGANGQGQKQNKTQQTPSKPPSIEKTHTHKPKTRHYNHHRRTNKLSTNQLAPHHHPHPTPHPPAPPTPHPLFQAGLSGSANRTDTREGDSAWRTCRDACRDR